MCRKGERDQQWWVNGWKLHGWVDGWMDRWWMDERHSGSMQIVKYQQIIKCHQMSGISRRLSEVNVLPASEVLLSFWFFCLQAEWVHSENVTGCLIPLHHQSPFLWLFLFAETPVCLFICLFSFYMFYANHTHLRCCTDVYSSVQKHSVSHFVMMCWYQFYWMCLFYLASVSDFLCFAECLLRAAKEKMFLTAVVYKCRYKFVVLWQNGQNLLLRLMF